MIGSVVGVLLLMALLAFLMKRRSKRYEMLDISFCAYYLKGCFTAVFACSLLLACLASWTSLCQACQMLALNKLKRSMPS